MLNKKELGTILISVIILGFVISLSAENFNDVILNALLSIAIIIFINVIFKKVSAFYLDTEIEINLWEGTRYGIKPGAKFRRPFQWGIIVPIVVKIITLGYLNWFAIMTFETKGKTHRAARRHGIYSFSEVTEAQMGYIAAIGIVGSLLGAFVGYLLGFETFAKLSVTYAFFNMIPLSTLDGNKVFFGNLTLWAFLAAAVSLAALVAILAI